VTEATGVEIGQYRPGATHGLLLDAALPIAETMMMGRGTQSRDTEITMTEEGTGTVITDAEMKEIENGKEIETRIDDETDESTGGGTALDNTEESTVSLRLRNPITPVCRT